MALLGCKDVFLFAFLQWRVLQCWITQLHIGKILFYHPISDSLRVLWLMACVNSASWILWIEPSSIGDTAEIFVVLPIQSYCTRSKGVTSKIDALSHSLISKQFLSCEQGEQRAGSVQIANAMKSTPLGSQDRKRTCTVCLSPNVTWISASLLCPLLPWIIKINDTPEESKVGKCSLMDAEE